MVERNQDYYARDFQRRKNEARREYQRWQRNFVLPSSTTNYGISGTPERIRAALENYISNLIQDYRAWYRQETNRRIRRKKAEVKFTKAKESMQLRINRGQNQRQRDDIAGRELRRYAIRNNLFGTISVGGYTYVRRRGQKPTLSRVTTSTPASVNLYQKKVTFNDLNENQKKKIREKVGRERKFTPAGNYVLTLSDKNFLTGRNVTDSSTTTTPVITKDTEQRWAVLQANNKHPSTLSLQYANSEAGRREYQKIMNNPYSNRVKKYGENLPSVTRHKGNEQLRLYFNARDGIKYKNDDYVVYTNQEINDVYGILNVLFRDAVKVTGNVKGYRANLKDDVKGQTIQNQAVGYGILAIGRTLADTTIFMPLGIASFFKRALEQPFNRTFKQVVKGISDSVTNWWADVTSGNPIRVAEAGGTLIGIIIPWGRFASIGRKLNSVRRRIKLGAIKVSNVFSFRTPRRYRRTRLNVPKKDVKLTLQARSKNLKLKDELKTGKKGTIKGRKTDLEIGGKQERVKFKGRQGKKGGIKATANVEIELSPRLQRNIQTFLNPRICKSQETLETQKAEDTLQMPT